MAHPQGRDIKLKQRNKSPSFRHSLKNGNIVECRPGFFQSNSGLELSGKCSFRGGPGPPVCLSPLLSLYSFVHVVTWSLRALSFVG